MTHTVFLAACLLFACSDDSMLEAMSTGEMTASVSVSSLLVQSETDPGGVDALILSNPDFSEVHVKSCLLWMSTWGGEADTELGAVYRAANEAIVEDWGTSQPSVRGATGFGSWALSMHAAVSGRPWVETQAGQQQARLAAQVLESRQLGHRERAFWDDYEAALREAFEDAMVRTSGWLVRCP